MTPSIIAKKLEAEAGVAHTGVDANFLSTLGNVVQFAGLFISILAGVTTAKQSATALDQAEERIMRLQKEVAEVELQVKRAKRTR